LEDAYTLDFRYFDIRHLPLANGEMMADVPMKICAWNPELNDYDTFTLVGEHGPYWLYESETTGYHILILKGEVWRYTDFSPCQKKA